MSQIADTGDHLAEEEEPSADALGAPLSLADTLEEDRERYQDVIRALTEFEEGQRDEEIEVVATAEEVYDLDAELGAPSA